MVAMRPELGEVNVLASGEAMALGLDVFGVIDKPVDMGVLLEVLNRLFMKKYKSDIFAE